MFTEAEVNPLKGVFGNVDNVVYHLNISDSTKPIFFLEENIMLGSAVSSYI